MLEFRISQEMKLNEPLNEILEEVFGKVPMRFDSTGYVQIQTQVTPEQITQLKQVLNAKTRTIKEYRNL